MRERDRTQYHLDARVSALRVSPWHLYDVEDMILSLSGFLETPRVRNFRQVSGFTASLIKCDLYPPPLSRVGGFQSWIPDSFNVSLFRRGLSGAVLLWREDPFLTVLPFLADVCRIFDYGGDFFPTSPFLQWLARSPTNGLLTTVSGLAPCLELNQRPFSAPRGARNMFPFPHFTSLCP